MLYNKNMKKLIDKRKRVILLEFNNIIGKLYPQRAKGVEADKIPWDNKNYTFQVKEDGDRRLLYFGRHKVINTSRSKGADTGLPVDKTNNVPHIRDLTWKFPDLEGTILDCEFIHNRGFQEGVRKIMGCLPDKATQRQSDWGLIEVYAFDIISFKGEFLYDKPLKMRLAILDKIYDTYFKEIPFFHKYKTVQGSKEELIQQFEELVANGGEGFVAKDINSTYRLSTEKCQSPLKNAWIKVKREFNGDFVVTGFEEPKKVYNGDHLKTHQYWECDEKLLNGNYFSQYVMGEQGFIPITEYYYKGWIGAIKFGEYENGVLVERGSISGMDKKLRAELSANPESFIGKVVEVDGMERIKKTKAIRQPVFKRFRNDKAPEDCIYENQKG